MVQPNRLRKYSKYMLRGPAPAHVGIRYLCLYYHVRHLFACSIYDIDFHSKLSSETATYTRQEAMESSACPYKFKIK